MSIQYTVLGFKPQPSEHESPPITTRPGLPPNITHIRLNEPSVYMCASTHTETYTWKFMENIDKTCRLVDKSL